MSSLRAFPWPVCSRRLPSSFRQHARRRTIALGDNDTSPANKLYPFAVYVFAGYHEGTWLTCSFPPARHFVLSRQPSSVASSHLPLRARTFCDTSHPVTALLTRGGECMRLCGKKQQRTMENLRPTPKERNMINADFEVCSTTSTKNI